MRPERILEHAWPGRAVEAEPLRHEASLATARSERFRRALAV